MERLNFPKEKEKKKFLNQAPGKVTNGFPLQHLTEALLCGLACGCAIVQCEPTNMSSSVMYIMSLLVELLTLMASCFSISVSVDCGHPIDY